MRIMVYNFKGGVGKTGISLNLALTMDFNYITNELLNPIEGILEEGTYIKLRRDQAVPILNDDFSVVYDFGGYIDKRAIKALKSSDVVIIPTKNEQLDLTVTVNTIQEIEPYNDNIVVVANMAEKGDFESVETVINNNYPDYKVYEIKKSRAVPNIFVKKISVKAMTEKGGLNAWSFNKINEQFNELIKGLKIYGKAN